MAFTPAIRWTSDGVRSRTTLMENIVPPAADQTAFCMALNNLISAFAVMRFSDQPPSQTGFKDNGYGLLSWQDGQRRRDLNVTFYFTSQDWVFQQGIILKMQAVN